MSIEINNLKLTAKRVRFCEEYAIDMNGAKAAIRAGYSAKTARTQASDLLTLPNVKKHIEELQSKIAKKCEISVEWVIEKQVKVIARCMQEEEVLDKDGNKTGDFTFDSSGANTGLKTLAKHLGMDKSTVDVVTAGMGLVLHLTGKPDEADD